MSLSCPSTGKLLTFPSLFPAISQVLDSIYFSRRFHLRCVAQARDKAGHLGTPLRSNIATIGTDSSICHTPVTTGTARGFQAQSFIATLKYLDVKHKEHPNRSAWLLKPHNYLHQHFVLTSSLPCLGFTSQCRSPIRMECCPWCPPCRCTTFTSCCLSPFTDSSTSVPTWSPSKICRGSPVSHTYSSVKHNRTS